MHVASFSCNKGVKSLSIPFFFFSFWFLLREEGCRWEGLMIGDYVSLGVGSALLEKLVTLAAT